MIGLSTMGSISFGCALVAGRKRVPSPAAGKTALRTLAGINYQFGAADGNWQLDNESQASLWGRLPTQCHSFFGTAQSALIVGRTPRSAADAPVGLRALCMMLRSGEHTSGLQSL